MLWGLLQRLYRASVGQARYPSPDLSNCSASESDGSVPCFIVQGVTTTQLETTSDDSYPPKLRPMEQLPGAFESATTDPDYGPELRVDELPVDSSSQVQNPMGPSETQGFTPNGLDPYAFENNFVRGKLLFLVNPTLYKDVPRSTAKGKETGTTDNETQTMVTALFDDKRYLFCIQLQLQFKQAPPPGSVLYIGGEVPHAMRLGFFSGRYCRFIMDELKRRACGLHYSFGNAQTEVEDGKYAEDAELPHVSAPLYTTVDQFVCTPAGQEPPALGSMQLGETFKQATKRKRSSGAYAFNTEDTYSLHFSSAFLDFVSWQLVNMPGLKPTDLKAFWQDMAPRLVVYYLCPAPSAAKEMTVPTTQVEESEDRSEVHSRNTKKYQLCFQLSRTLLHSKLLGTLQKAETLEKTPSSPSPIAPSSLTAPLPALMLHMSRPQFSLALGTADDISRIDDIQRKLEKYELHVPAWFEYLSCTGTTRERRVGYVVVVRELINDGTLAGESQEEENKSLVEPRKVKCERLLLLPATSAFAPVSVMEHGMQDLAQVIRKGPTLPFTSASISVRSRYRAYDTLDAERAFLDCSLQLLASPLSEMDEVEDSNSSTWNGRRHSTSGYNSDGSNSNASTCTTESAESDDQGNANDIGEFCAAQELLLHMIEHSLSWESSLKTEWPFFADISATSPSFPLLPPISQATSRKACLEYPALPRPNAVHVIRVMNSMQWRHEWLKLDKSNHTLSFSRMLSGANSTNFTISLENVLSVSTSTPFFGRCSCDYMTEGVDETLGSDEGEVSGQRNKALYWLHVGLLTECHNLAFASSEQRLPWLKLISHTLQRATTPSTAVTYTPEPTRDHRFVLNHRRDVQLRYARMNGSSTTLPPCAGNCSLESGCVLADPHFIVTTALKRALQLQESRHWAFPGDGTVKKVYVSEMLMLQDDAVMLQRVDLGSIMDDKKGRLTFFLNVFHLMVTHASLLGLLPKSKTDWTQFFNSASYHLDRKPNDLGMVVSLSEIVKDVMSGSDFRMIFALNCMTRSCPESIPIYERSLLDKQLDEATGLAVADKLFYDECLRVVHLPKVCDWYREEFAAALDLDEDASEDKINHAILTVLLPYAKPNLKGSTMFKFARRHPLALIARYEYGSYDFRFRDKLIVHECQHLNSWQLRKARKKRRARNVTIPVVYDSRGSVVIFGV